MPSGPILLIEDDPQQQRFYAAALETAGYAVACGETGEQAPRLCDLHGPRLILLDVELPGISGIETCRRLRRQYSTTTPIVFVTVHDRLDILRQGIEAGGDDFLVKGRSMRAYLERIGYWMGRRCLVSVEREAILRKVSLGGGAARERSPPAPAPSPPAARPPAPGPAAEGVPPPGLNISRMLIFIAEARDSTPQGFGQHVREKFALLGYAAGVVNALANADLEVKARFADHLRAVLNGMGVMTPGEIEAAVERWHTMYRIPVFNDACKQGEEDYARRLRGEAEARPTPIQSLVTAA
jgi:CheY-like chemotaxis protein